MLPVRHVKMQVKIRKHKPCHHTYWMQAALVGCWLHKPRRMIPMRIILVTSWVPVLLMPTLFLPMISMWCPEMSLGLQLVLLSMSLLSLGSLIESLSLMLLCLPVTTLDCLAVSLCLVVLLSLLVSLCPASVLAWPSIVSQSWLIVSLCLSPSPPWLSWLVEFSWICCWWWRFWDFEDVRQCQFTWKYT